MREALIRFGDREVEYLEITIRGRNNPDAVDYWDGNFLWCTAEVVAGAFRGSLSNVIRTEDLARFHPQLVDLHRSLIGEASFDTLDDWLEVTLTGDGRGHIEVRAQLCDNPIGGNLLEFRLSHDQTYLTSLIEQVRAALAAFPVVGQRDA
jgi:hypothetical protein